MDSVVTSRYEFAKSHLKGIYSALITPMNADESVNYDMLQEVITYQLNMGVEGFYCCGSSAESLLLTMDERKKIAETVVRVVDGAIPVIMHTGTIRTQDVIELSLHAERIGADAVSMIPPYYFKFSQAEIIGYYQSVLLHVQIPVILYNIPAFTGISFTKDNMNVLLDHPQLIGVKHTSQDLYGLERMTSAYPDKIYFNGYDEQFHAALSAGANAAIGTTVNLFYPKFQAIRQAYRNGNRAKASEIQASVNEAIEVMIRVGIFNAVKHIFAKRGLECGTCRAPFRPLTDADKALLHWID